MSRGLGESRRPNCAFVFHANGERIGDFRKAWRNACVAGAAWEIREDRRRQSRPKTLSRPLGACLPPKRSPKHDRCRNPGKSSHGFERSQDTN